MAPHDEGDTKLRAALGKSGIFDRTQVIHYPFFKETLPLPSTWTGMAASGVRAGPRTTCALCAGSKIAPWQGQTISFCVASYCTVQPACVQTALYATMLPSARWISSA